MKRLFKLPSLCLSSNKNLVLFQVSKSQHLCHSTHSTKTQETRKEKEGNDLSSLFNEINDIVGAGTVNLTKNEPGFGLFDVNTRVEKIDAKEESCTTDVCENASESVVGIENVGVSVDARIGNLSENEVSLLVEKVTEIIMGKNDVVLMEERLGKEGLMFDEEIVERVLKRCSRVPRLAFRFFNWVKLRNGFYHTTETYNTMMNIAGGSKEFGVVEELVEEMGKNSCEMDIRTWTILITHYGKAKMVGKALLMYEKMRVSGIEPDLVAYKLLLRALCNAGKADIAMEFYKEMTRKEMEADFGLFKLLLKCVARTGDRVDVDLVKDDMVRVCQIPESHASTIVLKGFCMSGKIREALEYIRELKNRDVELDAEIFEILLQGLFTADRITDALEIVDIMKKKNLFTERIHGIIIHAYLRRNDVSKALEIFQSMKNSGYLPTIKTYTNLMQHLFSLNDFQKASELYTEMLERGLELDCLAVMSMVAGLVRQKRISEAWNIFKSMEEKGMMVTPKLYIMYIKELGKAAMTDEIIKVLKEMKTKKVFIGDNTYKGILTYLEKRREIDKVEEVKQLQIGSTFYVEEGEENITGFSSRMQLSDAINSSQIERNTLVSQVLEPPPSSCSDHSLQEVCLILSSSNDWSLKQEGLEKFTIQFKPELVVDILRNCSLHSGAALQFFSWVEKQPGYNHTTETYNMAIKISGRAKDFRHMRFLANEMRRKGCLITQDTWTIMIMQYGRIGLTDIALRNFKEMKASGFSPTGSTYKSLIISLCGAKGRKVDDAILIFKEMLRAGHVPDKELIEIYLCCICEAGRLQDARKCVKSLCKLGFTVPLAFSFYFRALSRAGRLEEALTILDEVGREHQTLYQYTYGSLVHGLLRKGRLEDALSKIESMKQIGIHPTVHVYTSLIVYFFREEQIEKALEMVQKMKDEGCEPTVVTYSALIRGYMTAGKVVEAWSVFRRMKLKGPPPDFHTYSMFITCLCKVGKSEEALQLISEMVASGIFPSTVNFRTVSFGLNREGKQDLARSVLHMKSNVTSRRKFVT
ncbi:putative pentatricopeptide repeat-containing protein, mitochondrial [Heracleum sosnowskyi]|uniref:Pentatricopeptide repeat-containing protein, mitochondrial n=1 Tax=Heracleum sosnowskyi TaxID=360622 RepID=A0AAD8N682_9APIA|nr:putative pentatricopeptide repeat-containing protein, mitochondrial [Heracleum sosnowskyi]